MGKLYVIDGLDGCGKSTQFDLLNQAMGKQGGYYRTISFPDYSQPSSALVKMYLGGDLGGSPAAVNAYAASSFYAVDRYASYKCFWEKDYADGATIVAARYTTSNAIHQMTKCPEEEWDAFLAWLEHYEYDLLGLPRPDCVIFLDMPIEVSQKLLEKRYCGESEKKDIHERDVAYLHACRRAALYAADKLGWKVLPCSDGENPLSPEEIHTSILDCLN